MPPSFTSCSGKSAKTVLATGYRRAACGPPFRLGQSMRLTKAITGGTVLLLASAGGAWAECNTAGRVDFGNQTTLPGSILSVTGGERGQLRRQQHSAGRRC